MEIGQHRGNYSELESGIDEQIGSAGASGDVITAEPDCVFESSNCSGAHRDYSPGISKSPVDGGSGFLRDEIALGMNFVIRDAINADGLEGS